MSSARTREDTWPPRDAALEWFGKRAPWQTQHLRALRLFVVSRSASLLRCMCVPPLSDAVKMALVIVGGSTRMMDEYGRSLAEYP